MPIWGNKDTANNAPKDHVLPTSNVRGAALYGNTTPGAFVNNQVVGVYGISVSDIKNNEHGTLGGTPGWYTARWGTGPVTAINVIPAGSNGYSNNDLVKVTGGQVNALGNVVTNSTGGMVSVTLIKGGSGFVNTSTLQVAVVNSAYGTSNGTGGSLTVILGGRAGRRMHECIATVQNMANTKSDTI